MQLPWSDQPDLPPEAPLAMPVQYFHRHWSAGHRRNLPMLRRRLFLIAGSALIGLAASLGVANLLALDGYDAVDQVLALLSLALFAWIGFGFLNAAVGLVLCIARRNLAALPSPAPSCRVAVLLPVYNEDIAAVGVRVAQMTNELERLHHSALFDVFILSDSAAFRENEERALCRSLRRQDGCRIYYRRRPHNEGRKTGNIADWVRRFGAAYESMIVLDADSRMSGTAMARLAGMMEADASLGLIQTTPLLTAGASLFARWQQFAAMLYGPIASAGLQWWSGDEATFWGHNAILRVRAFAESCGLPVLPGAAPLGGLIMSHDMVEAALLRRHGWKCRMLATREGSYEESPPTLIDHAVRDRRWCQGNLQHLQLLDASGLHWISRLQLLMGASAYITSPLWLILLVAGLLQGVRNGVPPAALGTPSWLIAVTVLLLFGTKAMALIWAAIDRDLALRLGGWRRIALGVFVDIPLSILSAPIIMGSQCIAVTDILAGRPSGWAPQRRTTDGLSLMEAFDYYRWHVLLSLPFWMAAMADITTGIWELPVALGLLGAPLFAWATSRVTWGDAAARLGLFCADPAVRPSSPHAPDNAAPVLVAASA